MRRFTKLCICTMAAAVVLTGCSAKKEAANTTTAETTAADTTEAGTQASEETTADPGSETAASSEGLTTGADEDKVVLGDYKGVEVDKVEVQPVTDEEVEQQILTILRTNPVKEVPEGHVAQVGDTVNIDYSGKKDGVAFDGGTAEGQELKLGSGQFIAGFEDGLIGAKAGEKRSLDLTFPEDYGNKDLAGAAVVFDVTVNSFSSIVPELNDEFVLANSKASKNVDEYREEVKADLEKRNEQGAAFQKRNDAFMTALKNSEVFLTNQTIDEEYNKQLINITNQAQAYGVNVETLAALNGMDMPTLQKYLKQMAAETVRQKMFVNAIAESEKISFTDDAEREAMAKEMGFESLDHMKENYGEDTTETYLLTEKVASYLADNAVEK